MRSKLSDDVAAKVLDLHGSGKSIRALAAAFDVPRSTIASVLKRATAPEATETITPLEVETTIPTMIAQDDATQFLSAITTTPIPMESANEVKKQDELTKLAESMIQKPSVLNRKVRMPKEAQFDDAINKLFGDIDSKDKKPAKAPKQPAFLADIPAPSKADLITQITMNVEAFEPLLGNIIQPDREKFLKSLYSKSETDLSLLLGVMVKTRTLANATNQMRHTFYLTAQGAEVLTSRFLSMRTDGFSQALRSQDEEVRMIMKEIAMEKLDSLQKLQRPELRLAMLFTTTLLATDSANRMKDTAQKQKETKVPAATLEKHSDL